MSTTTGSRLSLKRERFVREFLVDGSASGAYKRSGYKATGNASETGGCRLLRNVQVRTAIDAARLNLSQHTQLTAAWVEQRLMHVVEDCLTPQPTLDRGGAVTGRFYFDSMGAIKALELLCRRLSSC